MMKNCDRGHSFSPYGPPSRQITCTSTSKHVLFCLSSVYHGPAFTDKKVDKRPRMKNGERFVIHSSTHLIGADGELLSGADWRYQTHVKNYRDFTHV